MKRFLGMIFFVAFVAAGSLFALTLIDINRFKPEIQNLAQELTGRTLTLEGPLRIGFSFTPSIVAEDVRFGNAGWGSGANMLEADRVTVSLSLPALLTGSVTVRQLNVRGAKVLLETNASGQGNWELSPAASDESDPGDELATEDLPHVVIDDLRLIYKSGKPGDATEVFLERADIEPRDGGVAIGVRGSVDDHVASGSGFLHGDEGTFSVSGFELAYDDLALTGKLEGTRASPDQPFQIVGELECDELNIDSLVDQSSAPSGNGLFSDAPLPFSLLSAANGVVKISISELSYRALEFKDVNVAMTLESGKLTAPIIAQYEGRQLQAHVSANNGQRPGAGVTFNAPRFDIGRFLKQMDATDLVDVSGHVGVDVSGRGQSVKALMASLNGKIDIVTGKGQIDSSLFELIAEDLLWALIPKGGEKGVADLTCIINELEFSGGVGNVAALALVTDKIRTSGTGTINLVTETIDVTLHPRPNDPGLLSLATPVNITGPLSGPSILPDTGAVLGDIALSVGAGLLTGGIGAILPLISTEDFDSASANACLEVVAAARGGQGQQGAREDKGLLDEAGEGAENVIKGVGDLLSSPFD